MEHLERYQNLDLQIKNVYLDAFSKKQRYRPEHELKDLILTLFLICLFIVMVLIIPQFEFFDETYVYPREWNVFSIYMICVFIVTNFTIYKFGIKTFVNTYKNYFNYKILNMETLITIGSLASYIMGVFLAIIYLIENLNKKDSEHDSEDSHMDHSSSSDSDDDGMHDRRMQVEMIVHMFESASLILLVVIVGKFLEGLAKSTIIKMTENMFPQD